MEQLLAGFITTALMDYVHISMRRTKMDHSALAGIAAGIALSLTVIFFGIILPILILELT